jgi:hypothetical protein
VDESGVSWGRTVSQKMAALLGTLLTTPPRKSNSNGTSKVIYQQQYIRSNHVTPIPCGGLISAAAKLCKLSLNSSFVCCFVSVTIKCILMNGFIYCQSSNVFHKLYYFLPYAFQPYMVIFSGLLMLISTYVQ